MNYWSVSHVPVYIMLLELIFYNTQIKFEIQIHF